MTYKTLGVFALAGAIAWAGATLIYVGFAGALIERSAIGCLAAAAITGAVLAAQFMALANACHAPREGLLAAALAFGAPSLLLSIAFAPGALRLFSQTAPQTDGRYGLYVLAAYLLVLGLSVSPAPLLARQRA